MTTKKLLGAAAVTVAIAGGGAAGALLGTPGTAGAREPVTTIDGEGRPGREVAIHHRRGPHLEAAAEALGMTGDELRSELAAGETIAEVAGERGVDIDAVVDAVVASITGDLRERVTRLVDGDAPRFGRGAAFSARVEAVAEALGVTRDELREAVAAGETIAEVAEAEGVDVQTVIDALVAEGVDAERADALVRGELRPGRGAHHRHRVLGSGLALRRP